MYDKLAFPKMKHTTTREEVRRKAVNDYQYDHQPTPDAHVTTMKGSNLSNDIEPRELL